MDVSEAHKEFPAFPFKDIKPAAMTAEKLFRSIYMFGDVVKSKDKVPMTANAFKVKVLKPEHLMKVVKLKIVRHKLEAFFTHHIYGVYQPWVEREKSSHPLAGLFFLPAFRACNGIGSPHLAKGWLPNMKDRKTASANESCMFREHLSSIFKSVLNLSQPIEVFND